MEIRKNRCVIFTGGKPFKAEAPALDDFTVACDYGYQYAIDNGVIPNIAMGDFDTFRGEIGKETQVIKYPSDKDDTDTLLAVKYAISQGFRDILIYGGFGGRLDHQYANLQTAAYAASMGVSCCMCDEENTLYAISGGELRISAKPGYSLSVFSHTDKCKGVSCKGLKYCLENAELTNMFPIGVSNEFTSSEAVIGVKSGVLFVILSKL